MNIIRITVGTNIKQRSINNRPVIILVDTDKDGSTDHFVVGCTKSSTLDTIILHKNLDVMTLGIVIYIGTPSGDK